MKKLFFIGLAVTAMCASCSSDDTVEVAKNSKAISFSSFVDKSVRATDTNLANLDSISVYGWRDGDLLFNAQTVTIADGGAGSYSPVVYWEGGKTYAFEAIAPHSGENGVTFAAAETGGKITFVNGAKTDLMYSKVANITTDAKISDPGTVNFTFKHLLSRVKFTFENGFNANDAAKITVKDVKITNAFKNASITPNAENATWETVAGSNNLLVDFGKTKDDIIAQESGETTQMYLIPVAQSADPSYSVTFTVELNQNGVKSVYNHKATIATGMEIGKSYNFTAKLDSRNITDEDLLPIKFEAKVEDWADYAGTDITNTVQSVQ